MKNISSTVLISLTAAVVLSGCANPPTTLGKVPSRVNITQIYGTSAAYKAADKFSFLQAEVEYPATGGYHRINIGDFLLGEVLQAVSAKDFETIRLVGFKSRCDNSSMVLPRAICKTDWTMAVSSKGTERLITSSIPKVDIGNVRVRQDQFMLMPIVNGDDFFQGQIGPLLKVISEDVALKLAAAIPN